MPVPASSALSRLDSTGDQERDEPRRSSASPNCVESAPSGTPFTGGAGTKSRRDGRRLATGTGVASRSHAPVRARKILGVQLPDAMKAVTSLLAIAKPMPTLPLLPSLAVAMALSMPTT